MIIDKHKLAANFGKSAEIYDIYSVIHRVCAQKMVQEISKNTDFARVSSVIDIGSGSGIILEYLYTANPNLHFTANDISKEMISVISSKFAHQKIKINYLLADAEEYNFKQEYDLVVSNFCCQWFSNFEVSVTKLIRSSKVMFAFSTLMDGTFRLWQDANREVICEDPPVSRYPNLKQIMSLLEGIEGYNIVIAKKELYKMHFDNAKAFFTYLRRIGANLSMSDYTVGNLKALIKFLGENFEMNYEVFSGILVKS